MTNTPFAGLHLGNLMMLSAAQTRSISAENFKGEKGRGGMATEGVGANAARDLGRGWKVNPHIHIKGGEEFELASIDGPGIVQHIWMTIPEPDWRSLVLRMYWDGEERPSVEVPAGDFFCCGWNKHAQVSSIPVAVNSIGGFNCYWPMPFRRHARITLQNIYQEKSIAVYYQITYSLEAVPENAAYLHAQWRRSNPLKDREVHTLLDGVKGQGHYVGTYIAWQTNNWGWWGEGEIKFYMDGDDEFPTICGTGTEDYFGGAYCFNYPLNHYGTYTTPYLGFHQCMPPELFGIQGQRFGLYRWHVMDPIRFQQDLRVTIQALGWRNDPTGGRLGNRFLCLKDDIASTAFWYQTEPHAPFPVFPSADDLEVI